MMSFTAYQRLETHMESLLKNPEFILLYVPEDGHEQGGGKMRLVRPAEDPRIQEEFRAHALDHPKRLAHYALSHVWGIPREDTEQHMWHEVGDYVEDEHGEPVAAVPMRPEKRQTLLALLRAHPGSYWWIDVLCSRVGMPLVIMGDIYKYCEECYAMIDRDPRILHGLSDWKKQNQMMRDYCGIRKTGYDKETQVALFRKFFENWADQLQLMYQLTQCKWWKRVWTWQEAVLPTSTYMVSEASGDACMKHVLSLSIVGPLEVWGLHGAWHLISQLEKGAMQTATMTSKALREFMSPTKYSESIDTPGVTSAYFFLESFEAFGDSKRTCMDPVDYVYGVLGVLDLDVPRMDDHRKVWHHFLTKLEELIDRILTSDRQKRPPLGKRSVERISISDKAYDIDLSAARNMADVYGGLLNVTYGDIWD